MRTPFPIQTGPRRARARIIRAAPAAALALLLVCGLPGAATSATSAPAQTAPQKKLNEAQSQLHSLEQQLVDQQKQFDQLQGQLAELQAEQQRGLKAYDQFSSQLDQIRIEITDARTRYELLRGQLDGLVRDAYIEGPSNTMVAIFDAQSQLDLGQRLDYLGQLSDNVKQLSDEASVLERDLEKKNEETRQLMTQQSQALNDVAASKDQVNAAIDQSTAAQQQLAQTKIQILDLIVKYRQQIREGDLQHLIDTMQGQGNAKYGDWATLFMKTIGAPTCQDNLVVMVSWEMSEGTSARYNPLATTYYMPGATDFNYAHVKNYQSLQDGLQAAKLTLEKGSSSYGYGNILKGFHACWPASKTAAAIASSSWCGCGSQYVAGLINRVASNYKYYADL
jgi:peptidoglycan hydrolase CwlO-like protein